MTIFKENGPGLSDSTKENDRPNTRVLHTELLSCVGSTAHVHLCVPPTTYIINLTL